jgi:hypothetical protein
LGLLSQERIALNPRTGEEGVVLVLSAAVARWLLIAIVQHMPQSQHLSQPLKLLP